jgi:hypothetical protein
MTPRHNQDQREVRLVGTATRSQRHSRTMHEQHVDTGKAKPVTVVASVRKASILDKLNWLYENISVLQHD